MNESNVNPEGGGDARSSAWYVVHKLLDVTMSAPCESEEVAEERKRTNAKILQRTAGMELSNFEVKLLTKAEVDEMDVAFDRDYKPLKTLEARIAAAKVKHSVTE
jgi:hypothetical protein